VDLLFILLGSYLNSSPRRNRERRCGVGVHPIRLAPLSLGPDGGEINEPGSENGPGQSIKSFVHLAVQFNLIIKRAQDVGDGKSNIGVNPNNLKTTQIISG